MDIFNDTNPNTRPLNIKYFPELIIEILVAEKNQEAVPVSVIHWMDTYINENYGVVWNSDTKQIVVLDGWKIQPNGDIIKIE